MQLLNVPWLYINLILIINRTLRPCHHKGVNGVNFFCINWYSAGNMPWLKWYTKQYPSHINRQRSNQMRKNMGHRKLQLLKKTLIKRLRIPPYWIRSITKAFSFLTSTNYLKEKRGKYIILFLALSIVLLCSLRWQIVCFKYQSQNVIG